MSSDSKKLQGASKVSRAVWPERIRWNLATGKAAQWRRAMMLRWFYQPGKQLLRKSPTIRRSQSIAPSYRWRMRSLMFHTHRRVAFSLPIISILLAVCLWQHWYVQLMLAALCTATNILILHLLFNDAAPIPSALAGRSLVSLPRSARTARPGKPSAIGTSHDAAGSHNQSGSYGAPKNVDRLNSRSPVEDKSQSNRPVPSMTFPDTPMPATPLIRVLETIDLSSTNVEHFLELAERAEAAPPSQEPPQQQPE
ncbi:MAG TPA: hypothetical protein VKY19_18830 [Ktedonosporobacter sp.]|nr:hypothetical protein [Ktedonosporobacter sp.]